MATLIYEIVCFASCGSAEHTNSFPDGGNMHHTRNAAVPVK